MAQKLFPFLGYGLGLRHEHFQEVLSRPTQIDWFEALTENYLGMETPQGFSRAFRTLQKVRKDYPVVFHGVSMSIGSVDPLNFDYLKRVKALAEAIQPEWISDHLCWTGVDGHQLHDLMPLPYTEEAIRHVVSRIQQAQDFLGRRILIENVSSYIEFKHSEMQEWDFVAEIARRADCGILLDVNNIYVSSINHGYDAMGFLRAMPVERVGQIHLAGHTDHAECGEKRYLVDTHDEPVPEAVWELYEKALEIVGPVSAMVERDDNIPSLSVLEQEVMRARKIGQSVNARSASISPARKEQVSESSDSPAFI